MVQFCRRPRKWAVRLGKYVFYAICRGAGPLLRNLFPEGGKDASFGLEPVDTFFAAGLTCVLPEAACGFGELLPGGRIAFLEVFTEIEELCGFISC